MNRRESFKSIFLGGAGLALGLKPEKKDEEFPLRTIEVKSGEVLHPDQINQYHRAVIQLQKKVFNV
jgi:hypothetical protein